MEELRKIAEKSVDLAVLVQGAIDDIYSGEIEMSEEEGRRTTEALYNYLDSLQDLMGVIGY